MSDLSVARAEIRFERRGRVGIIALDRPAALNALTIGMCAAIDGALRDWARDDGVAAVVTRGLGGRAYCAGGDVRAVAESGMARDRAIEQGIAEDDGLTRDFFRVEYRMNHRLRNFPKPLIALIDGVVMGGGLGLSMHGGHRVATERTLAAMPETAIGFFPDVGATYVLPRLRGFVGTYLALSGARLGPGDLVWLGLATDMIDAARIEDVIDALVATEWAVGPYSKEHARDLVDAALATFRTSPPAPSLADHVATIDACFDRFDVASILAALDAQEGDFAANAAAAIRAMSPTSCAIALEATRRGRLLDFDACLVMEYRLSQSVLAEHDFYEGIRALLIDKDKAPRWRPADAASVGDVGRFFAPPAQRGEQAGDLTFDD